MSVGLRAHMHQEPRVPLITVLACVGGAHMCMHVVELVFVPSYLSLLMNLATWALYLGPNTEHSNFLGYMAL